MRNRLREHRITEEVFLLALHYGEVDYDERRGRWVMLPRFPLPARLRRSHTALLIELPEEYPWVPPHGVYVDRDLPLRDHYYPHHLYNRHAAEGWAWLCLHDRAEDEGTWQPASSTVNGDNLYVLLTLVAALLDDAMIA